MLNLNQNQNFRTVHTLVFAHHCAQLSYTTQHRTVLVIFPAELQTSIKAQMLSIGRGVYDSNKRHSPYLIQNELTNNMSDCTDRAVHQRLVIEQHQFVWTQRVHLQGRHQFSAEFTSGQHGCLHSASVEVAADHLGMLQSINTAEDSHPSITTISRIITTNVCQD